MELLKIFISLMGTSMTQRVIQSINLQYYEFKIMYSFLFCLKAFSLELRNFLRAPFISLRRIIHVEVPCK